jgi:hypothetical protein
MESSEALRIIRALADGVDPVTRETLPAESVFQQPQTIRALERAAAALEICVDHQDKNSLPEIEHIRLVDPTQPWRAEEDKRLYMEFYRSIDFEIIAQRLGRSKNAVISRLMKLAKKKPRAAKAA